MAIKRKLPQISTSNRVIKRSKQLVIRHTDSRPWSDLPDDILELVTQKFSFADLTRFRLVCKNWNSFHRTKPLSDQHPWLLCFDDNGYQLHEPYSHLKTPKFSFSLKGFDVSASKKGWFLLRGSSSLTGSGRRSTSEVIAYNPFTTKLVKLPPLEFCFKIATFSTSPSEPDCVFFALDEDIDGTKIGIWRQGDKNWTVLEFGGFNGMKNVVFTRGSFYCSNRRGLLGVFSVEDQTWQIMSETRPVFLALPPLCGSHLVEFCGRIFLVLLSTTLQYSTFAYELDFSKNEWVPKDRLEETTIFVDGPVAMATAASAMKSKNRVYYIDGAECRFCSLTRNTKRSYPCPKPCYKLGQDQEGCEKLWIQPPCC